MCLMLFHVFWLFYIVKELDSRAKHVQSFKKLVGNEYFCAKYSPSGFV